VRRTARVEQVLAIIGRQRPVVVLARAIDARERLFMQQADQAVAQGDFFHRLHGQLVVVVRDVGRVEDRSQFVLGRRDLVVLGLGRHAHFPQLAVQIGHEGGDPVLELAEVMVFEVLALGRLGAEQGPSGQDQVLTLVKVPLVDQKILLLRAHRGRDALHSVVAKQAQDAQGLAVERVYRAQKRRFLVEGFAGVGAESGRDVERVVLDERG